MDTKVELKLLETIYNFKSMVLKTATFKEKEVQGKKLLTFELTFSDDGLHQNMVLVLDKNLTVGDYDKIYIKATIYF